MGLDAQKSFKRIDLFDEGVMFPIGGRGLGIGPKGAGYHIHVGVERDNSGIFIVKAVEAEEGRSKTHGPTVHISNEELQKGFGELFAAIRSNEIDPTHPRFKDWLVLIPRPEARNPDSPLAMELLGLRNGQMNLTAERMSGMFPEMFYFVNMTDITRRPQRQFKWALAYPMEDWRMWEGNMWWLRKWDGYFYLMSDEEQSRLMRRIFRQRLDELTLENMPTESERTQS